MGIVLRKAPVKDLKGTVSQDFRFGFFHQSSSPKPLKITLESFRTFSKNCGDVTRDVASQGAPPVSTTPVANLPPVSTTMAVNLAPTPVANNGYKIYHPKVSKQNIENFLTEDFFHLPP
jgi:hypothetical protein